VTLWAGVGKVVGVAVEVIEVVTLNTGSEVPEENCDGLWGV
jgi:hypothetical protein